MEKEAQKRSSLLFYCYNPQEERGGKAVAYILCNISGLNIHVIKLAVKAECRRQGLGKACLQEALRYAVRERRCISASLHVASDNEALSMLESTPPFTRTTESVFVLSWAVPLVVLPSDAFDWFVVINASIPRVTLAVEASPATEDAF